MLVHDPYKYDLISHNDHTHIYVMTQIEIWETQNQVMFHTWQCFHLGKRMFIPNCFQLPLPLMVGPSTPNTLYHTHIIFLTTS
jgi:hypothetical protein